MNIGSLNIILRIRFDAKTTSSSFKNIFDKIF